MYSSEKQDNVKPICLIQRKTKCLWGRQSNNEWQTLCGLEAGEGGFFACLCPSLRSLPPYVLSDTLYYLKDRNFGPTI